MKNKTIHLLVKTLLTVLVIGTPAACTYSAYHGLPYNTPSSIDNRDSDWDLDIRSICKFALQCFKATSGIFRTNNKVINTPWKVLNESLNKETMIKIKGVKWNTPIDSDKQWSEEVVVWVTKHVKNIREMLTDSQFMVMTIADANKAIKVLGSANASFDKVEWIKGDNTTVYTDYIVTIK